MTRTIRHAAFHIALVAMMVRALLPAGWMPNPTGMGQTAFVICSMDGPVQANSKNHGPAKPSPDDGRQRDDCPFAAAAHFAAPILSQLLLQPAVSEGIVPPLNGESQAAQRLSYPPQSPRAPPAIV